MTDAVDAVRLLVDGRECAGWKEVSISSGIERVARDFTLGVTRKWPGATDVPRMIRPGSRCEVYVGDELVLTGHVDATPVRYDASSISVGVTGRSLTADLVDCSAINEPGQWRGQKIERIAADMAQVYGVQVRAEASTGAAVTDHQIQQGESVFESIDRMLRLRGLLATDSARGELVFVGVGGARAATALVLGENILEADAPLDYKDRYSEYRCKGQRAGDDDSFGEDVSEGFAVTTDSTLGRRRVLLLTQSGQADAGTCRDRVQYERAYRAAKALATNYVVQGWRQTPAGALWVPNLRVRVRDDVIGFDTEMLIAEVEYRLSGDSGMTCRLQVGPAAGYVPAPEAAKAAASAKSGGQSWGDVQ